MIVNIMLILLPLLLLLLLLLLIIIIIIIIIIMIRMIIIKGRGRRASWEARRGGLRPERRTPKPRGPCFRVVYHTRVHS